MILVNVHPNVRVFTALLRMLWTFSRNFVDTWRKKGDCWEPVLKCGDKNLRCSHDCSLIAVRKLYWRFANFQISIKTIWLTSAKKQWWDDGVVWRLPGPGPGDCGACAKYSQHCAPSSLAYCTWTLEQCRLLYTIFTTLGAGYSSSLDMEWPHTAARDMATRWIFTIYILWRMHYI